MKAIPSHSLTFKYSPPEKEGLRAETVFLDASLCFPKLEAMGILDRKPANPDYGKAIKLYKFS